MARSARPQHHIQAQQFFRGAANLAFGEILSPAVGYRAFAGANYLAQLLICAAPGAEPHQEERGILPSELPARHAGEPACMLPLT